MTGLCERLRAFEISDELGNGDFSVCAEAADRIEALEAALRAARLQLEYLDGKFSPTRTTATLLVRLNALLSGSTQ